MKKTYTGGLWGLVLMMIMALPLMAQHSVARQWNEALLQSIRKDYARPTVHARNIWHVSIALYDAWACYTPAARTYFLGDTVGDYFCPFLGPPPAANLKSAQEKAMSYAAYRLLKHRFQNSPGAFRTLPYIDSLFTYLGYDPTITSTVYPTGGPAELGNYIAQELIAFGHQDSSNEQNSYANKHYTPVNPTLLPIVPGNPAIVDPNRWQPLTLNVYIDQSGNVIPVNTPAFLGPEWGKVTGFALDTANLTMHSRSGNTYPVHHDPGMPPQMDTLTGGPSTDAYKWNFSLVSKWSSMMDTADGVMWDISPASLGNIQSFPTGSGIMSNFYDADNGGDIGTGYTANPKTGQPYAPQMVHRGDYARVLAEFWADGPESETPPGHWFTILNYVNDHPQFQKKWRGQGPVLDELEWDVKSYFTLAGAVHDAAVTAWGIKGWYDYIRPISAIRYMADQGQSSDSTLPNYNPNGIPLDSGFVELVDSNDVLADSGYVNVGKVKLKAWRGPDYVANPATDMAGVGWILAENWWPYQRPSFVTPPFAGYVSGHSTFSRAAAEVMTMITGDAYFPGGMGEFLAEKNKFLVFEEGPSQDVTLQWATYRDASDQCSLSRIWGGIHPPADDLVGRLIGIDLGTEAFDLARTYWENGLADVADLEVTTPMITDSLTGSATFWVSIDYDERMDTTTQPVVSFPVEDPSQTLKANATSHWMDEFTYLAAFDVNDSGQVLMDIDISVNGGLDENGIAQVAYTADDRFSIEMENPVVITFLNSHVTVGDPLTGTANFAITATFSEAMDQRQTPVLSFPMENPGRTLVAEAFFNFWLDSTRYRFYFTVLDSNETLKDVDVEISGGRDRVHNTGQSTTVADLFTVDTENPELLSIQASVDTIWKNHAGIGSFSLAATFNEPMATFFAPTLSFPVEDPTLKTLTYNLAKSSWTAPETFTAYFDVDTAISLLQNIDVRLEAGEDWAGNLQMDSTFKNLFSINVQSSGVGLEERLWADLFKLYPNPLQKGQDLVLEWDRSIDDAEWYLYDLKGVLVRTAPLTANDGHATISTHRLQTGAYTLKISSAQGQWVQKLVVVP